MRCTGSSARARTAEKIKSQVQNNPALGMQAAVTAPAPVFVLGGSIITMGAAGSSVTSQVCTLSRFASMSCRLQ